MEGLYTNVILCMKTFIPAPPREMRVISRSSAAVLQLSHFYVETSFSHFSGRWLMHNFKLLCLKGLENLYQQGTLHGVKEL